MYLSNLSNEQSKNRVIFLNMNRPNEQTIDFQPNSKRVRLGDNENQIYSNNTNSEVLSETIISTHTQNDSERQSTDIERETNPNGNYS